ncbi:MAG: hypothetical protein WBA74_06455 [Cyclobacteriaceae bacterium]
MRTRLLRLLITLGMLISINCAKAQQTFIEPITEQTMVGQKLGVQVGYESPLGYEIGAFYQQASSMLITGENADMPRFYEQEFIGAFFAGTLWSGHNCDIKLNVRTGATNRANFTITPSVMGSYKLSRSMKLQCGVGMRNLRPTLRLGLRLSVFK